jgi:hypothetical protein
VEAEMGVFTRSAMTALQMISALVMPSVCPIRRHTDFALPVPCCTHWEMMMAERQGLMRFVFTLDHKRGKMTAEITTKRGELGKGKAKGK